VLALLLPVMWLADESGAQTPTTQQASSEQQLINWYYGAVFGTGVYRAGDRTVSVLQIPFAHELQEPNDEQWGVRVTAPISFGFYDFTFNQLVTGETPQSVGTVSLFPGIETQIPVMSNWRLKPYANVGRGWDFSGGDAAWIYATGVRSLFGVPLGSESEVSLGNQLTLAGYRQDGGVNQPMGVFVAGLNLETPSGATIQDRPALFGVHLIYYYYFKRLRFPTANDVQNKVEEQTEVAVSMSVREPVSFGLFDLDRIGLGYRFGGGVQGISLFFNLPY